MRTLLTFRVEPTLFCLVNILLIGYAYHLKETGGAHLTNGESELRIPSVYRLLKGLNVTRQVISGGNAVTFKQNYKNVKYGLGRHPMLSAHEMLPRILNARVYHGQDGQFSTKFQSRDGGEEKKGNFKISDETVSGKGEYSISSDHRNVGIKMKLRINTQQNHQQQKQQQQPKPTIALTPRSTTPQMCVVPCNTKLKPQAANCIPTQFEQEALNIHNRYRAIHNSPAMTLNCEMSKDASAYAQKLAEMDTLVKSSYTERPEQGESLSLGCYKDREETAEEAVKMWFDEVCQYTFGRQGPQPGTSHFTQLAWKESTELGIGKASNKQSDGAICTYIVARYKPQGDFERGDDSYRKNIEKGSFDDSYCKNIKKAGLDGGYGFKRFKDS